MAKLPLIGLILGIVIVIAITLFAVSGVVFKKSLQSAMQSSSSNDAPEGKIALATILKSKETGLTVEEHTELELLLKVIPEQEPPFQVRLTTAVYRLNAQKYRPGATLKVKYYPGEPSRLELLTTPEGSSSKAADPAERLKQLKKLRDQGLITEEDFQRKKQQILDNL